MSDIFDSLRSIITILFLLCLSISSRGQKDTTKTTSFAIYPAFGYQPETKAQLGTIAIWIFTKNADKGTGFARPTSVSPFLLYTLKGQVITAIDTDIFFRNGMNLTAVARYFNFPDNYYGIGNDNEPDDIEDYTNNFTQVQGQLYRPLNSKVFIGATFDLQRNWIRDIDSEGRLINDNIAGTNGGFMLGLGPSFKYDSRDNTIYPAKGIFASSEILVVHLGDYQFTNYNIEFRKFVTVKNAKNILGFHFSSRMTSGNNVPFYKLPQLGGDERLRGIENASLYRDKQAVFLQTEYRRDLFWRFGFVAFAGIGDVANRVRDLSVSEFKYVAGFGGRFAAVKGERLNIRVDMGFAKGGQKAIYIGLREVF